MLSNLDWGINLALGSILVLRQYRCWIYLKWLKYPVYAGILIYGSRKKTSIFNFVLDNLNKNNTAMSRVIFDAACLIGFDLFSYNFFSIFSMNEICVDIVNKIFQLMKNVPYVAKKLMKEKSKLEKDINISIKEKSRNIGPSMEKIPVYGESKDEIRKICFGVENENNRWRDGKVSGTVYHGESTHHNFLNEIFGFYSLANPLHADLWPSLIKFESEIISMTANLMNGNGSILSVCGCTTSGGTESIILAVKSHRDFYQKRLFNNIISPEIICGTSAHAALDKACDLMNIRLIKIPLDPYTYQCDVQAMNTAINSNTIMLYASAPCYPQGVIDPIEQMGALALKYGIGLHVDCCLGGFILPFAKKAGFEIPGVYFAEFNSMKNLTNIIIIIIIITIIIIIKFYISLYYYLVPLLNIIMFMVYSLIL